jgi:inorganic pyrophosphatase
MTGQQEEANDWSLDAPRVEVVIEIPRYSFLKRGSTGNLDFISPLPCPFNYGSVPSHIGGEGDLLDAVVLGARLPAGTRIKVPAWGAVGLAERYMRDDKLICAELPLTASQKLQVLVFFKFYARCKGLLNALRGQEGASYCTGWTEAESAIARARPVPPNWDGPDIPF